MDLGRYAEAEPLAERALAIREKALEPEHPRVAASLISLARLYKAQGRYAEAEPLLNRGLAIKATNLKRGLAIREKALGPDHPDVATSMENYASLLRQIGRNSEAEAMEASARAIRAMYE